MTVERSARARAEVVRWWRGDVGVWGRALDVALAPAELAYRAASGLYHRAYSAGWLRARRVSAPVLSVGNIEVGGTGKTPVTRWLASELRRRGERPGILHGGYADDEPALHRAWHPDLPVVALRDRIEGAHRLLAEGATVLILDDAFQHRRIARDLDIVLVAAESWTERPRLLPRGPWREPLRALGRARVVMVTRKAASRSRADRVARGVARIAPHAPVVQLWLEPVGWRRAGSAAGEGKPPDEAVAVAGVGRPEHFFANVAEAGVELADTLTFPDHHAYVPEDVARIRRRTGGGPVVTTAKDAIKLESISPGLELWVLEQRVRVESGADALQHRLDALVRTAERDGAH